MDHAFCIIFFSLDRGKMCYLIFDGLKDKTKFLLNLEGWLWLGFWKRKSKGCQIWTEILLMGQTVFFTNYYIPVNVSCNLPKHSMELLSLSVQWHFPGHLLLGWLLSPTWSKLRYQSCLGLLCSCMTVLCNVSMLLWSIRMHDAKFAPI